MRVWFTTYLCLGAGQHAMWRGKFVGIGVITGRKG